MSNRLVHVGFHFAINIKAQSLETYMTAIADDWIRYTTFNWILWTDKPTPHISTLIQSKMEVGDQFMIAELGNDFFGNMPDWVWLWLKGYVPSAKHYYGDEAAALMRLPSALLKNHSQ